MFENVLTSEQMELAERLLPHCQQFYMVGGTALALHIGHRRSLDFDLASCEPLKPFDIERNLMANGLAVERVTTASADEFSVFINGIRVTFLSFPFEVRHDLLWQRGKISLPDLPSLAAMKAYALGRRSKWKDYVDLYFVLKYHLDMETLIEKAEEIFASHFNARLFREQLCYFEDIDYSEDVEYLASAPLKDEIRQFLEKVATAI